MRPPRVRRGVASKRIYRGAGPVSVTFLELNGIESEV